jgi:hypothetical protein
MRLKITGAQSPAHVNNVHQPNRAPCRLTWANAMDQQSSARVQPAPGQNLKSYSRSPSPGGGVPDFYRNFYRTGRSGSMLISSDQQDQPGIRRPKAEWDIATDNVNMLVSEFNSPLAHHPPRL